MDGKDSDARSRSKSSPSKKLSSSSGSRLSSTSRKISVRKDRKDKEKDKDKEKEKEPKKSSRTPSNDGPLPVISLPMVSGAKVTLVASEREAGGMSFLEMLREGDSSSSADEETPELSTPKHSLSLDTGRPTLTQSTPSVLERTESASSLGEGALSSPRFIQPHLYTPAPPPPEPRTREEFVERIKQLQEKKVRS